MKKITLMLLFVATVTVAKDYGLHFDDRGNIIKPDQHYLWQGIDDEKDGFRQSAFKNFMKAAEFGNFHAMSLVALYHMQDQEYLAAHAWFNLIDLAKIPNRAHIEDIVRNLEQLLSPEQLQHAKDMKSSLAETYGAYPTLLRREEWKNNMKFTGTHLKGYIPNFLRIQLNSGAVVTGSDLKEQMEDFIYEYEFSVVEGDVNLDEIELIEVDEDAAEGEDGSDQ